MVNMTPKDLDFETWEQLYEYILESKLNGQHKQSKEIYKSLSNQRQVEFVDWLREILFYDMMPDEKLKEYQSIINYYESKS